MRVPNTQVPRTGACARKQLWQILFRIKINKDVKIIVNFHFSERRPHCNIDPLIAFYDDLCLIQFNLKFFFPFVASSDPFGSWGVCGWVGLSCTRLDRVHPRSQEQPGAKPGGSVWLTWWTGEYFSITHEGLPYNLMKTCGPSFYREVLIFDFKSVFQTHNEGLLTHYNSSIIDFLPRVERRFCGRRADCVVLQLFGTVVRHTHHGHPHARRER